MGFGTALHMQFVLEFSSIKDVCELSVCLQENSTLIVEINNLRRQLKDAHDRIRQFENPQEVTEHLQMAVQNC